MLRLVLRLAKTYLFHYCVYAQACTTKKTRSLVNDRVSFWRKCWLSGLTGLRGRAYNSKAHMTQPMTRAQPPLFSAVRMCSSACCRLSGKTLCFSLLPLAFDILRGCKSSYEQLRNTHTHTELRARIAGQHNPSETSHTHTF